MLNPGYQPQQCLYICMQVYGSNNDSATMLATNRSAGVAPDVNLRNPLHSNEARKHWNPGQISPKVQNKGISVPHKRLKSSKKNLKKNSKKTLFGLLKWFLRTISFLWVHSYLYFGILVTSAPCFKASMGPLSCMLPQIHLWVRHPSAPLRCLFSLTFLSRVNWPALTFPSKMVQYKSKATGIVNCLLPSANEVVER